jgi:predicted O-methyltransferase YrrM
MGVRAHQMMALMDRAATVWRIPIVGKEKARLLRRLLKRRQPRRALEIGSLLGYSAILIASELGQRGRLTCIEQVPYLAKYVKRNAEAAGLGERVAVIVGDARHAIGRLRGRYDFVLLDAEKRDYLRYLRQLEPRLNRGAIIVADNTGIYRSAVRPYLEYVRTPNGRYESREYPFGEDAMEVSMLREGDGKRRGVNGSGLAHGPRRRRRRQAGV